MDLESIAIKIARSENLPVLPQIVSAVLKLADDPNASARAMEQVIERDPSITAKLLRVSNSAYYGLSQVSSVNRAISVLGMNTVRSLVVSIAYQQLVSGKVCSTKFDKTQFWLHSLAVGTACRILGKMKEPVMAEELYSAGLMHDVGILALDRFAPEELDSALALVEEEDLPLSISECRVFGFEHSVVGNLLITKWGLSGLAGDAIRYHKSPEKIPEDKRFLHVVAAADAVANEAGFTNQDAENDGVHHTTMDYLQLPEAQLEIIKNVIVLEVGKAQEVFQIN